MNSKLQNVSQVQVMIYMRHNLVQVMEGNIDTQPNKQHPPPATKPSVTKGNAKPSNKKQIKPIR